MEKKLEVQNLKISFRTNNGKVQAVRNISFDLYKGETLAIVGESGSGKSVTNRAVMGILAGNGMIESGKIIYDGKDLVRIPEEEMVKLRGDKIAMIFQDPLSSLNPIMRIGKQITEAMLLKNKASRRNSKKDFNKMLEHLKENMIESCGQSEESIAKIEDYIKTFDSFNISALELENAYNVAHTQSQELVADISEILFRNERKQKIDVKVAIAKTVKKVKKTTNVFLTSKFENEIANAVANLVAEKDNVDVENGMQQSVIDAFTALKALFEQVLVVEKPNFFRIGYYKYKNPEETFVGADVAELNAQALTYLDENFMKDFIEIEAKAVENAFAKARVAKTQAIEALNELKEYVKTADLADQKALLERCSAIYEKVKACRNELATVKDSAIYTFKSSLNAEVERYYFAVKNNPKEEARFAKQTAKREALIARGKTVDWKVVPKVLIDLDQQVQNIITIIEDLKAKFESDLQIADVDYTAKSVDLIDYFKEKASGVVNVITKKLAREKAVKLMEEVGIPNARIRYRQYPFEFSGGMRQRIVIAIALAADPDILICDEPTTALDVTIQAQILELINKIKKERGLSVIFITHDLGVVANMADRIAVMYAGKIVEYGTADDIFYDPRHPYTWALLSSMPDLNTNDKLESIPGTPPNMIYPPVGDAFAERNKYALEIDFEMQPPFFEISETHQAATWLLHPDAPKVDTPKIITDRIEAMKNFGGAKK